MSFRQPIIFSTHKGAIANTTFFEVSKTSALAATIVVPTSSAAGDFGVLVNFGANPQPANTTPSGWTQAGTVADATGVGHRVTAYTKYLVSGDVGATITGFDSGSEGLVLFVFRNLGWFITQYSLTSGFVSQATTGNPDSMTITPTSARNMVVGIKYTYGGTSAFSTNPFDSTEVITNGVVGSLIVGYKYQFSTTSGVTFDSADDGNAQTQAGFLISFNDIA